MDWFFRGQFGADNFFSDDEFRDKVDKSKMKDSYSFSFINPFHNGEDPSHKIFQHVDEMFNKMFFSSHLDFGRENFEGFVQEENDPRSMLLKEPDNTKFNKPGLMPSIPEHSTIMIDSDIDDEVSNNKWLLEENPIMSAQPKVSYRKFSSIRTLKLPNGTVEEQQTFTDDSGNTITKIRRSIGDQSHEVTTHSDKSGLKEKLENFTNLDEIDLTNFDKQWQSLQGNNQVRAIDIGPKVTDQKLIPPTGDPSYVSVFKKFFGL